MDLGQKLYTFMCVMFGMFSLQMMYSADYFFGPYSPGGMMIYWTKPLPPMGDWWARGAGIANLTLLAGPKFFDVPLMSFMKQILFTNTLFLAMFVHALTMPEGNTLMMKVQTGIQVVLTLLVAYVVKTGNKPVFVKGAKGKTPKRGATPMKKK
ncbi:unnamed protein product [Amoebophrya sp. A120]|nr:unnamed protein product [Amoebophrya sp. A120]|eukprot:GSA120T00011650001.1